VDYLNFVDCGRTSAIVRERNDVLSGIERYFDNLRIYCVRTPAAWKGDSFSRAIVCGDGCGQVAFRREIDSSLNP
jgi:hypothetical protein